MDKHQFKRVKERTVKDAYESVAKWRDYFENGYIDQGGIRKKATLQDAAILVGIPKKTLEDYYQLLKKVQQYGSLNDLMDKKMGDLRKILKQDCQDQIQSQAVYQEEDDYVEYVEQNIDQQYYQPQYECDLFLNLDPQDTYYSDYDTFTLQVVDGKQIEEQPIEKADISDENLIDLLQQFSFLDKIDQLKEEFKEEQEKQPKKDDKFQLDEWENCSISDCETNESDI